MLKAIPILIAFFLLFSFMQVFFSIVVYWHKVGFSLESLFQYTHVNGQLRSSGTFIKMISPHLISQGLSCFILCHFLQFSKRYKSNKIQQVIRYMLIFTLLNVFSTYIIRFLEGPWLWLKPFSFIGFLFFYSLSSWMILNSFLRPFQSRIDTNS